MSIYNTEKIDEVELVLVNYEYYLTPDEDGKIPLRICDCKATPELRERKYTYMGTDYWYKCKCGKRSKPAIWHCDGKKLAAIYWNFNPIFEFKASYGHTALLEILDKDKHKEIVKELR